MNVLALLEALQLHSEKVKVFLAKARYQVRSHLAFVKGDSAKIFTVSNMYCCSDAKQPTVVFSTLEQQSPRALYLPLLDDTAAGSVIPHLG